MEQTMETMEEKKDNRGVYRCCLYLNEEMYRKVKAFCEKYNLTVSSLLKVSLAKYLKDYEQ